MTDDMKQPPAAGGNKPQDNDKLFAAFSYVGILFVIPLFAPGKKSPFVQFHVKQGIVLFVIEVILSVIPFFGMVLIAVPVIVSLYALMQALSGRQWEIPFIGQYAKRISL